MFILVPKMVYTMPLKLQKKKFYLVYSHTILWHLRETLRQFDVN